MEDELVFATVDPSRDVDAMRQIRVLLTTRNLDVDDAVEEFVVALQGERIVACAGLAGSVVRCTAVSADFEGHNVLLPLMNEVSYRALDRGHSHLFLYTKPQYREIFESCGFHTIAQVPQAVLMENTPFGIRSYAERLISWRRLRDKIGGIVVNANPFTLGHAHLIRTAAQDCDFLHVFVVSEDASQFAYRDRLSLVRAGVAELPERDTVLVHPGSPYMVSKATFPTYFLKESDRVAAAATGIDLLLFREHIAPALGITHRYVGNEPFCAVTRQYNEDMHYWLELAPSPAPPITVVEIPRMAVGGRAVSATSVRRLLAQGQVDEVESLVPRPTFDFLKEHYALAPTAQPQEDN